MNNWRPFQLRDLADKSKENSFTDGDWIEAPYIEAEGIRLIQTGNVGIGEFLDSNKKYISSKTFRVLSCKEVVPGDVLICRLADPIGRACIVPPECSTSITSVDVTIFRIDEERFEKRYVVYSINTDDFLGRCIEKSGGTTRQRISRSNLGSLELFLPDLPLQRKIALILTTIDNLIEKTEALIEKYQSIKQGMMHDLFTRGVTENGELRPPYEEAPHLYKRSELGWIPKEWEVKTIGSMTARVGSGITPTGGSEVYLTEGIIFIRSQNVTLGGLDLSDVAFINERTHVQMAASEVFPFDVLLNITGASIGRCCYVPADIGRANTNQHVCCIRLVVPNEPDAKFLSSILSSPIGQNQIFRLNAGGNREGLNYQQLRSFRVPWTNEDERKAIAIRLDSIDKTTLAEQAFHLKLLQQKQGLMQDLLTGKVPVKVEKMEEAANV